MGKNFDCRRLHWIDVNHKFESLSFADHVREAASAIQRIESDGLELIGNDSAERWKRSSRDLQDYLRSIGTEDLKISFREFIHLFEHETERMYQMLHGSDEPFDHILVWFDLVYRHSTYAILARFLPEKNPKSTLRITISILTGKLTEEGKWGKATTPKQYRKHRKKVWQKTIRRPSKW